MQSLVSTAKVDWSQVMSFDFDQLKNLELSPFFRNHTLKTNCFNFPIVSQGLGIELAGFYLNWAIQEKKT